jgi:indole-3-glycerol phosphate synthase
MEKRLNILEEIAAKTRERVAEAKNKVSLEEMKQQAESLNAETGFPFENAIKKGSLSFICEVKKASPSKGLIAGDFPYVEIAKEYEKGGASAISVLTEPYWFMGSNEYLKEIRAAVDIPIIRKDFTVDEYMIYEAKVIGADAVLLICAILDDDSLKKYMQTADKLGLSALVDRAVKAGARLIGVNNRDLRNFTVDINNSLRLRNLVPDNITFVSESGIKGEKEIRELAQGKVDGVLIGETMMRAGESRIETLKSLIKAGQI